MRLSVILIKVSRKSALIVLLCISSLFFSCQKEQLLVRKIEGTYKIERIIYNTSHGDSLVNMASGIMFFDDCALKSKKRAQQCDGFIDLNVTERISFGYRPEKNGEKISMFFNIRDVDHLNRFGGRYIAEERTGHAMTLVRYRYDEYHEKEVDLQIFLTR